MKPQNQQHPAPEQLAAFVQGRLSPADQARLEPHIAQCAQCCEVLSRVPDDTLVSHLHGVAAEPTGPAGLPEALRDHPRYRIVRLLGSGGMGVVYQAEHRLMERPVALKIIHRQLVSHPAAVERFRQEVRAAARLGHPNIVAAYDAEQAGDLHFLVTEYVDGVSLAQWVERNGPMPVAQACDCVRQAALGLEHAFEQGMVHRDIKPQNLMLTPTGQVKILDFGLARLAREEGTTEAAQGAGPTRQIAAGMTAAGSFLGTPEYAAPEQARSARDVDIRADIYSLGRTLRFLIEGRAPGGAGSGSRIPPGLAPVLARMTALSPAERYATPAEVARALVPLSKPPSARPTGRIPMPAGLTGWTPVPPKALAVGGAVLLVLLVLNGVFFGGRFLHENSGRPAASALPTSPATTSAKAEALPVLVVVAEQYNPGELLPVLKILRSRYPVKIVSTGAEACRPVSWKHAGGEAIKPDLDLVKDELRGEDFRGIFFPGGMIAKYKNESMPCGPQVGKLIADMHKEGKCVAALGEGIRVLGAFRPFKDISLAQFDARAPAMFPEHDRWDDQPIVYSGAGVLTGRSSENAAQFGEKLLRILDSSNRSPQPLF